MNDTSLQELLKTNERVCSVTPDYIMVTDMLSDKTVTKLTEITLLCPKNVIVCIDHDTPNSSIAIGARQRKLINWAVSQHLALEKCQGVGYLRLLEHYVQPGQIVIGTGRHIAGLGAAGVLGLTVSEEELLEALATGRISITVPPVQRLALTGSLSGQAAVQDAALALMQQVRDADLDGSLLVIDPADVKEFSPSQLYDLCHLLQQGGVMSAVVAETKAEAALTVDLSQALPLAVLPGSLDQAESPARLPRTAVDEVFIGGCRGGKLDDLRQAAAILKGRHIAYRLRLVVSPATSDIYIQALQEGLIDIFLDSGAVVMNQGCSVCWGKAQGILDAGEVLVSTGSYNYAGCSGDKDAQVYLASPQTAARCALTGILE